MIRLQERIAALMECGATLERVDREVIEPCGLTSDEKSALRLFAVGMAGGQTSTTTHFLAPEVRAYG